MKIPLSQIRSIEPDDDTIDVDNPEHRERVKNACIYVQFKNGKGLYVHPGFVMHLVEDDKLGPCLLIEI